MHKSMFGYILANSKREQFIALVLTLISFPFLYFSLDLPKTIIDKAIEQPDPNAGPDALKAHEIVDIEVFGFNFTELFGTEMERLPYLFLLCFFFLLLVCVNGAFKMRINTYKGIM